MLLAYYPSAAISWVLGALNLLSFLLVGVGGLAVTAELWLMLYVNSAVLHIGVYFWNRKHNVSPHEQEGSSGRRRHGHVGDVGAGLRAGAEAGAAAAGARLRRHPQGRGLRRPRSASSGGTWAGALLLVGALIASIPLGHMHVAIHAWAVFSALMCLLPVALWMGSTVAARRATADRYVFTGNTVQEQRPVAPAVVVPQIRFATLTQESPR